MKLSGKTVVVVGLGRSGLAVLRVLVAKGARAIGTDVRPLIDGDVPGAELILGGHDAVPFDAAELIVVSPGVPSLPRVEQASERGVEVIGELEFACRFVSAPVVAVGGTNGKSTTTTLVGDMLSEHFARVFVGGNLGQPLTEVMHEPWDALVLEVSSFQLERVRDFRPRVSVLLNVSEDHLDRYPSFDAYVAAKGNAFLRQGSEDFAVVPAGDARLAREARRGAGALVTFGAGGSFSLDGADVVEAATGTRISLATSSLVGRHNWSNAAAAIAAVRSLGVPVSAVERGLAKFRPLPHRLARVATRDAVTYYDDSKGTNVDAAATAVRGLPEERVVLIAGGRDKLGDYRPLVDALVEKRGAAVLIGEATQKIALACDGRVEFQVASDMRDAVRRAGALAKPGDAVLLSPACSSFDMFKNYADRGDRFAEAVLAALPGGTP